MAWTAEAAQTNQETGLSMTILNTRKRLRATPSMTKSTNLDQPLADQPRPKMPKHVAKHPERDTSLDLLAE